jgi:hypothetical protein
MKNLILTALVISLGLIAVGCANNKKPVPKNESVTELNVAPVPPRDGGYAAAPAPAAPIYVEPAVTQTPAAPAPVAAAPAPASTASAGSAGTR